MAIPAIPAIVKALKIAKIAGKAAGAAVNAGGGDDSATSIMIGAIVGILTIIGMIITLIFGAIIMPIIVTVLAISAIIFLIPAALFGGDNGMEANLEAYKDLIDPMLVVEIPAGVTIDRTDNQFTLDGNWVVALDSVMYDDGYRGDAENIKAILKKIVTYSIDTITSTREVEKTTIEMVEELIKKSRIVTRTMNINGNIIKYKVTEYYYETVKVQKPVTRITTVTDKETVLTIKSIPATDIQKAFPEIGEDWEAVEMQKEVLDQALLHIFESVEFGSGDIVFDSNGTSGPVTTRTREGIGGKFEYDASLQQLTEIVSAKRLIPYNGNLIDSYKTITTRDGKQIQAPIFKFHKRSTVSNIYRYSLAAIDGGSRLAPVPTAYTGGGTIYLDREIIPVVTAMIDDAKAAGHNLQVIDGYRSQSTQAEFFVRASANQNARSLNYGDQVQKWISSKTGKTVGQLKNGDYKGIDWIKLTGQIISPSAPSYIKQYASYITPPLGVNPHSTGRAIDFHGMNFMAKNWLQRNAAKYGLYNYSKEIWHWEYNLNPDKTVVPANPKPNL